MTSIRKWGTCDTGRVFWGTLTLALSSACAGESVVGDAAPTTTTSGENEETTEAVDDETTSFGGSGACAEHYESVVEGYDAWKASSNDWDELSGKVFEGYIEGGSDLTLSIDSDGSGTLVVGTAVSVGAADEGYLCKACGTLLQEGGSYPIYGASLENSRLIVPLDQNAAFDPWCALQEPVIYDTTQDACKYSVARNDSIKFGSAPCMLGEEEVDCGWLDLADLYGPTCVCTPTECFAEIYPGRGISIDARLSDTGDEISGTLVADGNQRLYLFEVKD